MRANKFLNCSEYRARFSLSKRFERLPPKLTALPCADDFGRIYVIKDAFQRSQRSLVGIVERATDAITDDDGIVAEIQSVAGGAVDAGFEGRSRQYKRSQVVLAQPPFETCSQKSVGNELFKHMSFSLAPALGKDVF